MGIEISLKGKIAVVTGATGQLGRVMAKTLASCGADIAVHYLKNKEKADEIIKEITESTSNSVRAIAVQADITDEKSVNLMRDKIKKELGDPDIVVNNAVIQYQWVSVLEQDLADFQSQFDSCVKHNVLMAKAFIPAMIDKNGGRFIGVNTECSYLCNANSAAYASAKRGMDGLYRTLAKEVGKYNITVNQVAPGWTISERDRLNNTEIAPEYSNSVPLRRRGTDQEIANVVLFLASHLSSFVSGVCIPVCGGTVMV